MLYWIFKRICNFSVLICFITSGLFAQENSPYSRYGLGNLKSKTNVANLGMGGVTIADNNPLLVNIVNPAGYASLQLTTYQLGVEGVTVNVQNSSSSNRVGAFNLSYMNIGIPLIKDKFSLAFGLSPFSRIRYNMQDNKVIPGLEDAGIITSDYFGGGSIQTAFFGTAYKWKGFSLGANLNYSFGNYQNNLVQSFVDSNRILSATFLKRTVIKGFHFDVGGMYQYKIGEDKELNVGFVYSNAFDFKANRDSYVKSSVGELGQSLYQYSVDSQENVKGEIHIPSKIGVGLLYKKGDYWQVGLDYDRSDWSDFSNYGNVDSFGNAYMFRLGAAITPDVNAVLNYWKRVTYRAGFYYGQQNIYLNQTHLKDKGVSLGIGYPIRRTLLSIGQINMALQVGTRGTTSSGLLKENYTRFQVGITVNDRWFIKRKYD